MNSIIVSISGGKDSTATALHLKEQGVPYKAVHMHTGWDHPITEQYIREELPKHIGEIEIICPERTMKELILNKGMFPSRIRRFCTQQLKIFPFMQYIDEKCKYKPINVVGIRGDESSARSKLGMYEDQEYALVWRPILNWSFQDVVDIHQKHDVPPNPLYTQGMSRVGCWPCIFARKAEIRMVSEKTPWRIDEIRDLENEVKEMAAKRYATKGETFESLGYQPPTFFTRQKTVESKRKTYMENIDKVVAWSKTKHGGKEPEPYWTPDKTGCMAWGLCDF